MCTEGEQLQVPNSTGTSDDSSQLQLFRSRRFLPLFLTQFGGAFNDNFYKSALLMLFTYSGVEGGGLAWGGLDWSGQPRWGLTIDVVNNLISAMLIVPFLLFAAMAGQFADKYEKSRLIRGIKLGEIAIMLAGCLALYLNSPAGLLLILFFTGTQSACFSPLKYSILPQHVSPQALTGANGLMHGGTSVAIFLGLIAGSLAIQLATGRALVAVIALLVALAGWFASRQIPLAAAADTGLRVQWQPGRQMLRTLRHARENSLVLCAILGISWYWFLGSVYLTQLPNFTRSVLHGAPAMVTLLLVMFLVGVCSGALLCERLSRRQVEPGLVPLAAILVALFGFDLYAAGEALLAKVPAAGSDYLPLSVLLIEPQTWRVMADVLLLGVAGGLYVVPLSALMQSRSRAASRAQVVAANNVFNALFMVAAAVIGVVCLGILGQTIPQLFLWVTLMHVLVCSCMFVWQREFPNAFLRRFWQSRSPV